MLKTMFSLHKGKDDSVPRPKKCRRVCCLPRVKRFVPHPASSEAQTVTLSVDEYETIRLIDREGFSQEDCGIYMQVARTTVQQIYNSARSKLAYALVEGLPFQIDGGEYRLCDGKSTCCQNKCGKPRHNSPIPAENRPQKENHK